MIKYKRLTCVCKKEEEELAINIVILHLYAQNKGTHKVRAGTIKKGKALNSPTTVLSMNFGLGSHGFIGRIQWFPHRPQPGVGDWVRNPHGQVPLWLPGQSRICDYDLPRLIDVITRCLHVFR